MLEIIVRIVVAGCLMVGSHCPLKSLQPAPTAPAQGTAIHVDPTVMPVL